MGFRNNAYCTVWSFEPQGDKWSKVRASISKRDKETGEYTDEWSGFIMLLGDANRKARKARLKERDRIQIKDTDVTTRYVKETGVEYTNYKCWDIEVQNRRGSSSGGNSAAASNQVEENTIDEDDIPF